MDEKRADHLKSVPPSLTAAIRRARVEGAEQNEAVAELREAEIARLQLLEEAIRPIISQAPAGADLFDAGVAYGETPRLFIDMIGFVEMAHDRRTYRFLQDTRHGRVLIAETERMERAVAAITNYVARRLVEREKALASDWRSKEGAPSSAETQARAVSLANAAGLDKTPSDESVEASGRAGAPARATRRGFWTKVADLFSFLLLVLGSMTLCLLVAVAAYLLWEGWGRALWTAWIGPVAF